MGLLISIDNGGTLTDACVINGDRVFHAKTLTTPHDLTQCFVDVLREVSTRVYGEPNLDTLLEQVDYIRYSTTQGTNAVVERKGPRLGLILRHGQDSAGLVRNDSEKELLGAMVGDRMATLNLEQSDEDIESAVIVAVNELMSRGANRLVVSLGGANLAADESRMKRITLLRYPRHLLGAVPILYSHQLSDDTDDARRTWSSLLNAFLHPAMERFLYSAEGVLRERRGTQSASDFLQRRHLLAGRKDDCFEDLGLRTARRNGRRESTRQSLWACASRNDGHRWYDH